MIIGAQDIPIIIGTRPSYLNTVLLHKKTLAYRKGFPLCGPTWNQTHLMELFY